VKGAVAATLMDTLGEADAVSGALGRLVVETEEDADGGCEPAELTLAALDGTGESENEPNADTDRVPIDMDAVADADSSTVQV
jgi:hypothetical protein